MNAWLVVIRCNFDDVPLYLTDDPVHARSTAEAHSVDDCYEFTDGNLVGTERVREFLHEAEHGTEKDA